MDNHHISTFPIISDVYPVPFFLPDSFWPLRSLVFPVFIHVQVASLDFMKEEDLNIRKHKIPIIETIKAF